MKQGIVWLKMVVYLILLLEQVQFIIVLALRCYESWGAGISFTLILYLLVDPETCNLSFWFCFLNSSMFSGV